MRRRTSCRSQATKVQSPRISSVGSRRSGTIIVVIPADDAGSDPVVQILQSPAQGRLDAEQLSSFQEWIHLL